MADWALSPVVEQRTELTGDLVFASVPSIWSQLEPLLRSNSSLTLSLGGVERADSAGLALLIEGLQRGWELGNPLRLEKIPASLWDLAGLCNVAALLQEHSELRTA
jgi:phospholipid transport system transporter-binding protein